MVQARELPPPEDDKQLQLLRPPHLSIHQNLSLTFPLNTYTLQYFDGDDGNDGES